MPSTQSTQHIVQNNDKWDAIVVGAGPGGSSAAFHMASAGLKVLLVERHSFPRDKSCGDGITQAGVQILNKMGVLEMLDESQRISGVRVHLAGQGHRDFRYREGAHRKGYGLVVRRWLLDHALCRRAIAAGAVLQEETLATGLLRDKGAVVGVRLQGRQGNVRSIYTRVVVAADGANSVLARQSGLHEPSGVGQGIAIRGYYENITGLEDLLEFYMLLTDTSDRYLLPSYGWVFPVGPDRANIGVGLFELDHRVNLRNLLVSFLNRLAADARFTNMQQSGTLLGAPLRADFNPSRCGVPGLLLVGDAAGMVSPFTGEGISFALEGGRLAAETTVAWMRYHSSGPIDPSDYQLLLGHKYAGYFETGAWSMRRYRLIWQVLQAGFRSERPVHRIARQLILAPEGIGEPTSGHVLPDVSSVLPRMSPEVRSGLLEIGEMLTSVVRRDWPFLTRLSIPDLRPTTNVPFRPSLLLLLCGNLRKGERRTLARAGAATELGFLSFLVQGGVEEDTGKAGDPANWGNVFCVLLADFLLAKAFEQAAETGIAALQLFTDAITRATSGLVRQVEAIGNIHADEALVLRQLQLSAGTLGELPCALGATLTGAAPETIEAVSRYGRGLAMAHALVDEVLSCQGSDDLASHLTSFDLKRGSLGLIPVRALKLGLVSKEELQGTQERNTNERGDLLRRLACSATVESVIETARRYADEARDALAALPQGSSRVALERLTEYVLARYQQPTDSPPD